MHRSGRKNPRLQDKLDAIQREIARMESEIKGISRAVETPDSIEALRRLKQVPSGGSSVAAPLKNTGVILSGGPVQDDVSSSHMPGTGTTARPSFGGLEEPPALQLPKTVPDPRFNTYFGTGSLHSVRPLRQERRVQRNKAIFMLIIAGLLIVMVLKMIF